MSTAISEINKSAGKNRLLESQQLVEDSLRDADVAILSPVDVLQSIRLIRMLNLRPTTIMLDPWYNKGVGGVRDDYREYIIEILREARDIADHIYLWGFPEIVATFVERLPDPLYLVAWLTWYYKNNPSVIRGWRSSQMACLHICRPGAKLYPQHFLNGAQKEKQTQGKLRYMPGPTSVIEAPLNIGFVGKKEQTGHPAQKPLAVIKPLLEMATEEGDLVFDPMSGSGTTAEAAKLVGRRAIISDHSEEYTCIAEKRLNVRRIALPY
jgi:hypothetical protein